MRKRAEVVEVDLTHTDPQGGQPRSMQIRARPRVSDVSNTRPPGRIIDQHGGTYLLP